MENAIAKYIRHTRIDIQSECHVWTGALDKDGYALVKYNGKMYRAARFFYGIFRKSLLFNRVPDHLCRNTSCVNPYHLEDVSFGENSRRGIKATRTHCKRGHELTVSNIYYRKDGFIRCRTCMREAVKYNRLYNR